MLFGGVLEGNEVQKRERMKEMMLEDEDLQVAVDARASEVVAAEEELERARHNPYLIPSHAAGEMPPTSTFGLTQSLTQEVFLSNCLTFV